MTTAFIPASASTAYSPSPKLKPEEREKAGVQKWQAVSKHLQGITKEEIEEKEKLRQEKQEKKYQLEMGIGEETPEKEKRETSPRREKQYQPEMPLLSGFLWYKIGKANRKSSWEKYWFALQNSKQGWALICKDAEEGTAKKIEQLSRTG